LELQLPSLSIGASIAICFAGVIGAFLLLRRDRLSLGLPLAFLLLLVLEHVPGAWAISASGFRSSRTEFIEYGIAITSFAILSFFLGLLASRYLVRDTRDQQLRLQFSSRVVQGAPTKFLVFCLIGGWAVVMVFSAIDMASLNAVLSKAGGLWMLGALLGLASGVKRKSIREITIWVAVLLVYPMMLLLSGFTSGGAASIVIVTTALLIYARSAWTGMLVTAAAAVLGVSLFVSFFSIRDDYRRLAWGGAGLSERVAAISPMFSELELVNPGNREHVYALDQRLNQNYFVGVAATRLGRGDIDFWYGESLWQGLVALVPRAIWPGKPVTGGGGRMLAELTGIDLDEDTAWLVGPVLELYANFALVGVLVGFIFLGYFMGRLDRLCAIRLAEGRFDDSLIFFLPCVALIQPLGSVVELTSGGAAALIAALMWKRAWHSLGHRAAGQMQAGVRPRRLQDYARPARPRVSIEERLQGENKIP
jgi:hypothetical protein